MYQQNTSLERATREVMVRITEVNTITRILYAEGARGTIYQVSFAGLPPFVAIPQIDERWVLSSTPDFNWRLKLRLENGTEGTPLETLRAGDRRIDANALYIATKRGTILNSKQTYINQKDEPDGRPDGVTLFSQNDQLMAITPDGKKWQVSLTPID